MLGMARPYWVVGGLLIWSLIAVAHGTTSAADEFPTWRLSARVVAVGLPGVAGVRQVGRFHRGGPIPGNPEFLLTTGKDTCSIRRGCSSQSPAISVRH